MSLIPLLANELSLFDAPLFSTSLLGPQTRQQLHQLQAAMNLDEDEKQYTVHVDLPGMKPEEISLDFNAQSGVLTIKAAKSESKEKSGRVRRSFTHSFTLPQDANADGINAHLENGVLSVTLPKRAPPAPRKIPITSATEKTQIGAGPSSSVPDQAHEAAEPKPKSA